MLKWLKNKKNPNTFKTIVITRNKNFISKMRNEFFNNNLVKINYKMQSIICVYWINIKLSGR